MRAVTSRWLIASPGQKALDLGVLELVLQGPNGVRALGQESRWMLVPNDPALPKSVPVASAPFVIGRSRDCHLILPESEEMRAVTSRWHSHIILKDGQFHIVDGSIEPAPETGRPKPSATGTVVNGRRISEPTPFKNQDTIEIGPWRFKVKAGVSVEEQPLDTGDLFHDILQGESRIMDTADPKLREKFGHLHELVQRLAGTPDIEESLTALLSYATGKIAAAEVAAVLLAGPEGSFRVRLAWEKTFGKAQDFRFSSSLLNSLPPEQSFLLKTRLKERSESQTVHDIGSGLLLPLWGKGERLGVFYLDNRRNGQTFTEEDMYLGAAIASLISLQLSLERSARLARTEENMARYFAPDVVRSIVELSEGGRPVGLDVQERNVTVVFVDMEGFTTMSRSKTPKEISEILNPYFETVARAIQGAGGHVNKFIGDAVMGIFGAQPGQAESLPALYAEQAVTAALSIPGAWEATARRLGLPPMRLRIGINAGRAVVGNIGYAARLEYSVLGDTVNIASRLEKLAPPGGAMLSEQTKRLIEDRFEFDDAGEQEIRGVGKLRLFVPLRPKEAA